jgi:hypothetical protein
MIAAFALILVAVLYRVAIPHLAPEAAAFWANFAPLSAIALCGAVWLPKKVALYIPLLALFVSDLVLNSHYGFPLVSVEMILRYVSFAAVAGIGLALRANPSLGRLIGGSFLGSLLFYVVTNTGSWIGAPEYAKTFGGWIQALTVGVPGFPPTWHFFRNTVASDLLFTTVFAACMFATSRAQTSESAAPAGVTPHNAAGR